MTLTAVPKDGNFLALEHVQIGVSIIVDLHFFLLLICEFLICRLPARKSTASVCKTTTYWIIGTVRVCRFEVNLKFLPPGKKLDKQRTPFNLLFE